MNPSNPATPAIVTEAGARPLSRAVLWLMCLTYLLPGQWSREVWRPFDLGAFGYMAALAEGRAEWLNPTLAGLQTPDGALLPYWIGAWGIQLLPFDPALAARLPFLALLLACLALLWYATFHLARTDAAQPVSFAFGGEAQTIDYARALADAALLALMATLGFLMAHEATPAIVQLLGTGLWIYALAAAPYRAGWAQTSSASGLVVLALSGAPFVALLLGLAGWVICHRSRFEGARRLRWGLALGIAVACASAVVTHAWAWRIAQLNGSSLLQLIAWYVWPSGALALWTLWRWRRQWSRRHVAIPLSLSFVALLSCLAMGGQERALLIGLPGLAILAAFAIPTLNRSLSAMVDWFSLFLFSATALFIWAYYLALHTGWPPRLMANVNRLAPGFVMPFDSISLVLALAGTLAWLALVRWRTSRQRAALWRSLALPAGGVALMWLLMMTLWRPALDHGMGQSDLLRQLRSHLAVSASDCIAAPHQSLALLATLEAQGGWTTHGTQTLDSTSCHWAVVRLAVGQNPVLPNGWTAVQSLQRSSDRGSRYWILKR
ncbi:hypothetical protein [Inhella gelatinilytica]|uniref:4-amino-4-deoxy-L-arabinose transferase-like glycosyltransferase n=1 Tax=Inhella gelatinilytica TaxID=2795030 RepID=A0A931NEL0_9BURK|nr:hypothetical protein [Inhella gelatinilytica]MBH9553340.1 hypothetical protein [Inhella gelatinilytica]